MSKPDALKLADLCNKDGYMTNIERSQIEEELRRLHAETTNQKDWLVECRKWEEEAKRLTLENEALRKDAERYRWLANRGGYWETEALHSGLSADEYTAAVDAAMKEQA